MRAQNVFISVSVCVVVGVDRFVLYCVLNGFICVLIITQLLFLLLCLSVAVLAPFYVLCCCSLMVDLICMTDAYKILGC